MHRDFELLRLERLGEIVGGAGVNARHRRADSAVRGDDDDRHVRSLLAAAAHEFLAAHARHIEVRQHYIQVEVLQLPEPGLADVGDEKLIIGVMQDAAHDGLHVLRVIDHQYRSCHTDACS